MKKELIVLTIFLILFFVSVVSITKSEWEDEGSVHVSTTNTPKMVQALTKAGFTVKSVTKNPGTNINTIKFGVKIPTSKDHIGQTGTGGGCSVGSIIDCIDDYGCSGTQTCLSSGQWGPCSATEYTTGSCTGTVTSCSNLASQSSCQQQQASGGACSWTAGSYTCLGTSTYPCSSLSEAACGSDYRCIAKYRTGGGRFDGGESIYLGCYTRLCSTWASSQSTCGTVSGCSWSPVYTCTGTATSCASIQATCVNNLGYAQWGCSSGYRVVCGVASSTCNNNNKCEQNGGLGAPFYNISIGQNETQETCPNDCFTFVDVNPDISLPSEQVALAFTFNDSRYVSGHLVSYQLLIDGVQWNDTNGCPIANKNVTATRNGVDTACTWAGITADCTSTSLDGYLQVRTTCRMPKNITATEHTLLLIPTFYSEPTQLNGGVMTFVASNAVATITGNAVRGGTTLKEGLATFAIAQINGANQLIQNFISWITSSMH